MTRSFERLRSAVDNFMERNKIPAEWRGTISAAVLVSAEMSSETWSRYLNHHFLTSDESSFEDIAGGPFSSTPVDRYVKTGWRAAGGTLWAEYSLECGIMRIRAFGGGPAEDPAIPGALLVAGALAGEALMRLLLKEPPAARQLDELLYGLEHVSDREQFADLCRKARRLSEPFDLADLPGFSRTVRELQELLPRGVSAVEPMFELRSALVRRVAPEAELPDPRDAAAAVLNHQLTWELMRP